jgi:site-specific DNA-cytosine methylase
MVMDHLDDERSKVIWSFFTGAGGLDLGLERNGLHASLAVELDRDCCKTLRLNRPRLDVWETDIANLILVRVQVETNYPWPRREAANGGRV